MIESLYGVFVLDSLAELMLANTDIPASSTINPSNIFVVPEPSTLMVIAMSMLAFVTCRRHAVPLRFLYQSL